MQIAFVVYDGLTVLDLVGPLEVLSRLPDAEVALVATTLDTANSDNAAMRVLPDLHVSEVANPDVIVVPGGVEGTWRAMQDDVLIAWLQEASEGARWVTSVCSGSLILGVAGLLTGRRATSHWIVLSQLERYGATPVSERFVIDGNLATSAGVSAGIDLALWLAADLAGEDHARTLQLVLEYDPEPPFDAGTAAKAGRELVAKGREMLLGTNAR